jgi:hypothetical protein
MKEIKNGENLIRRRVEIFKRNGGKKILTR